MLCDSGENKGALRFVVDQDGEGVMIRVMPSCRDQNTSHGSVASGGIADDGDVVVMSATNPGNTRRIVNAGHVPTLPGSRITDPDERRRAMRAQFEAVEQ